MIDLTGKIALVTGGARGIGRAIVLRLARQGADVAFSYRGNAEAAAATVAEVEALGRRALAIQGDVSDPATADALVKATLEAFGTIDILVNNAGITRDDLIMRMSLEAWREVLETNLFGAFYAIKAVTRPMLKARRGRIINITSVSGQAGPDRAGQLLLGQGRPHRPDQGHGPRAGQPGHHRQRRGARLRRHRADPGPAGGAQGRRSAPRRRSGRFGTAEEVADAVAFLASDEAAYITGQVLAVDGGLVMM